MDPQVSVAIAAKMRDAVSRIEEAVDYMSEHVEPEQRAPLNRAMGEVFGIITGKIYSRLVRANPELHDVLFRGLPKSWPDDLLRMYQSHDSTNPEE